MTLKNNPSLSVDGQTSPSFTLDKKKVSLAFVLMVFIAVIFWTQSRMPALDTKAQLGARNSISSIAFDIVMPVDPDDHFLQRVAHSAVNWGYTNWKGMTFGLLFAAAFLTLLKNLPKQRQSSNPFVNAIKGAVIGVPLGVCANCSTPIAQGMVKAGTRLEMALSTLMSSPTWNIIVVSMMISLLPIHLVAIKMLFAAAFILVVMPLLVKYFGPQQTLSFQQESSLKAMEGAEQGEACDINPVCDIELPSANWGEALNTIIKDYAANFFYIIKATLPLMLLAGVLGAFVIEAVPFEQLTSLNVTLLSLLVVATMGALLPVPIAFDIIMVTVLVAANLPTAFCMVLLFSLGIFSIYPAMVIAQHISLKLSVAMLISTILVAAIAGAVAGQIDDHLTQRNTSDVNQAMQKIQEQAKVTSRVTAAVKHCQSLGDPAEQNACLYQAKIEGLIPSTVSAQDCAEATGFKEGVKTGNSLYQACLVSAPVQEADCASFADSTSRDLCYLSLSKDNSKPYCDNINNPFRAIQCRQRFEADASSKPKDCKAFANDELRQCQRASFVKAIDAGEPPTMCRALRNKQMTTDCFAYFSWSSAKKNSDIKLCAHLRQANIKSACRVDVVMKQLSFQLSLQDDLSDVESQLAEGRSDAGLSAEALSDIAVNVVEWTEFGVETQSDSGDISISRRLDKESVLPKVQSRAFEKFTGNDLGLDYQPDFSLANFLEPFKYGRGIASGDYNNDGWPDLVLSTPKGVLLYKNLGTSEEQTVKFAKQHLDLSALSHTNSFVVSFVDINNDGWLDLYFTNYAGPNIFIINNKGSWDTDNPIVDNDEQRVLTISTGFADKDKDGDLDIYLGNWTVGGEKMFNPTHSQNYWLMNQTNAEKVTLARQDVDEPPGETLALLLSDINSDNNVDLIVTNDRQGPDIYYTGDTQGSMTQISVTQSAIPETPLQTMSVDSADFNNDLRLDLFLADLHSGPGPDKPYCEYLEEDKPLCHQLLSTWESANKADVDVCNALPEAARRKECLVSIVLVMARNKNDLKMCDLISSEFVELKRFCRVLASTKAVGPDYKLLAHVPQVTGNKLLINRGSDTYRDDSKKAKVDNSFWAWNSKAADLDNDEWQDIYSGNGFGFNEFTSMFRTHSNVFYHNQQDGSFVKAETEFGLEDFMNTPSYTYVDLDLDGDLDIVSTGSMSAPRVFINHIEASSEVASNSISFALRDFKGNRYCIGCKVVISYSGKQQVRELKLSGGYLSFDESIMHFGLGKHEKVDSVEIFWSTGEKTLIEQDMAANHRYQISRH